VRKETSEFITKCISDAGSFKKNRDFTGFINLDNYACWVVVDGIDSSDEKLSAEIAASSIIEDFTQKPGFSKSLIKKYIKNAHKLLLEHTGKSKFSASIMVVISDYNKMIFGSVGNARLYHLRKDKLIRKSKDHSITRLMNELGEIDGESADKHKHKNTLYSYLGKEEGLKIDVSSKIKLFNDDVLLLSTQGMWENINEKDLGDVLKGSMDAEEFAENIEYIVKENDMGNLNNYSIMSLFIPKVFDNKEYKKKVQEEKPAKKISFDFLKNKYVKKVLLVIIIALIAGIGLYIKKNMDSKAKEKQQSEAVAAKVDEGEKLMDSGNLQDSLANFEEAKEKYKDDPVKLKEIEGKIAKIKATMTLEELEIQGDKNFEAKDYEGATNKFTEALNIANAQKVGNISTLEEKLNKTKDILKYLALEKTGDDSLAKQDYDEATKIYQNIVTTADPNKFSEITTRVKEKVANLNKIADAIGLERQGIEIYKKGKYAQARTKFEQALSIYSETGMEQKKKEIKSQIAEIEDLQVYEDTIQEGKFLEEAGDNELDKKNYEKAENKYNEAIKKYQLADSTKNITQVTNKLDTIDSLKKHDLAKEIEADGDVLFSDKKYKKAIEKYEEAKKRYNDLNKPEDYNAMDEKIKICKKKDKVLGIF